MSELLRLQDLFESALRDLYDAEGQILEALPWIIDAAGDDNLRRALSAHLEETRMHVDRLEQAFGSLDLEPERTHCAGMAGILEEGNHLLNSDGPGAVLDAALIAVCQRVEHYEITAYGSLMTWGKLLVYTEVLELLKANEQEAKAADTKLSRIAESAVNRKALASSVGSNVGVGGVVLLSVHQDNPDWTSRAGSVLESTGAEDLSSPRSTPH